MRVMTMTKPVLSILLLLLYAIATSANPERGRLLYENHCRSCHESNVHIRQTQAAKSLKAARLAAMGCGSPTPGASAAGSARRCGSCWR